MTSDSTVVPVASGPRPGAPPVPAERPRADPAARRLRSLDAARGLAIAVMLVTMNPGPLRGRPEQLIHPTWEGLRFVDLFFPLFLFAVGVSMTLSRRSLDGRQVLRRAAILFGLGVGLSSLKHEGLFLTGVLQHIAVSYVLAAAVLRAPRGWHRPLAAGIVVALWAAYVLWAAGGDPWGQDGTDTLAHAVDDALYGGFRTEGTLQGVMSTVTVLGGAFAGYLIHRMPDRRRLFRALAVRSAGIVGLGLLLALAVPINKRLWSPSFAVLTVGTSYAMFAACLWALDIRRFRRLLAPLIHLGTNPITIYVLFMTALALSRNYGPDLPRLAPLGSPSLGFLTYGLAWTALWWLLAFALYRRRIFLKV